MFSTAWGSFALDAFLDESAISLVACVGLFGRMRNFVSDDSETKAVFTGASRFNSPRSVQEELFCSARSSMDFVIFPISSDGEPRNVMDFGRTLDGLVGALRPSVAFHGLDCQ